MKTRLLDDIEEAAQLLRQGKLVAFPTETVFGLGVDARSAAAVQRLFEAKGRPADNPLIVHLAEVPQWPWAARELTPTASKILELYAPGPVTVVLPKAPQICSSVTAGLDSVGIRIPAAELAHEILALAGIPIAAPSANRSGRPSGTTWQAVLEDLEGRIDAIVCHDVSHLGLESSVIDCTGAVPVLLRTGAVGLNDLQALFPAAQQLTSTTSATHSPTHSMLEEALAAEARVAAAASPGLKHPHYQPRARVLLLEPNSDELSFANTWQAVYQQLTSERLRYAYAGLSPAPYGAELSQQFASLPAYAQGFYEFLRVADRAGVDVILLQAVAVAEAEQSGLAAALRDRQRRAAGLNA